MTDEELDRLGEYRKPYQNTIWGRLIAQAREANRLAAKLAVLEKAGDAMTSIGDRLAADNERLEKEANRLRELLNRSLGWVRTMQHYPRADDFIREAEAALEK